MTCRQHLYTKEGLVIVMSTPADRKPILGKRIEDGPRDELAKMAEGVVAYAGRYEMKDGKVHHNIQVSFFPPFFLDIQEFLHLYFGEPKRRSCFSLS